MQRGVAAASICSGFCGRVLDVPEMTAAHTPVERLHLSSHHRVFSGSLAATHTAESSVLGEEQDLTKERVYQVHG